MDGVSQGTRAAVLIDGGYYDRLKALLDRPDVDIVRLSNKLCGDVPRLKTYYFDALPWVGSPSDPRDLERQKRKQSYLDTIKLQDRMELRLGHLQRLKVECPMCRAAIVNCPHCNAAMVKFQQKLVDVKLSVEMVRLAWNGQARLLVLLSGDSDFVPAVQAAKDAGAVVRLAHASRDAGPTVRVHDELLKICDERVVIDGNWIADTLRLSPPTKPQQPPRAQP